MDKTVLSDKIDLSKGVKTFSELEDTLRFHKESGEKIVLCHGVFDLLHVGHIRHMKKAKAQGDILVVTVTPDCYVNKGPNRPAFGELLRAEAISSLEFVDYVAINQWANAVETIKILQPDVYSKGKDYIDPDQDKTGGIILEKKAVESVGGKIIYTEELTFSSSTLINRHFPIYTSEMNAFIKDFSKEYSYQDIEGYFEALKPLKVLLVGDAIIDDYHFCRTMGKPGKDPILAACYERNETFVGGVLAVANHVAKFSQNVDLVTFLGSETSYENFIREELHRKVKPHFLKMLKGKTTIVKRRFLENYPLQKLFEIYMMDNDEGSPEDSDRLCETLDRIVQDYDVVIVTDYGHGMMSSEAVDLLAKKANFLAVNTQVNAGNQAFNTISKYPRADFVSISENEIRIDVRSKRRPLKEIVKKVSEKLGGAKIIVTRGVEGLMCYDSEEGFFEVPAFMGKTIDRVGAGDSVLAVSSLCAQQGISLKVIGLVGNAVGFQAVQTVGNKTSVDREALLRSLEHCLK
jgi:rfaE bifunctional protein kinase chain/domain/rfaE bifunctional protein nucleotidyltransferase chain/domain